VIRNERGKKIGEKLSRWRTHFLNVNTEMRKRKVEGKKRLKRIKRSVEKWKCGLLKTLLERIETIIKK